ncbi:hypothetical protein HLI_10430 [Halobacillus litoralis]|uniref:Uncharacterized protein n=2 Tax=Bacillaceae TaxID=186817 RepID=A0A410MIQ5_9BACI|nr:hypothetical protein HLI_10430 [Halobacillus litoralis]
MHQQGQMKPNYNQCNKFKYYHVMVKTEDGRSFDGIITDVNHEKMTILISEDVTVDENGNSTDDRQYYGGYGRRRARRFRREVLPLAGLATLALFPYLTPYPYYPYPSPYPYYY